MAERNDLNNLGLQDLERLTRKKTSSFQITSVTVGSRVSNEGEDSNDDLDESHTDDLSSDLFDVSKTTDADYDCSTDEAFYPPAPSGVHGEASVASVVNNTNAVTVPPGGANPSPNVSVTVMETRNIPMSVVQNPEIQWQNRFRVVKIEKSEPFRRGRWLCMDFVDPPASQSDSSDRECFSSGGSSSTVSSTTYHGGDNASHVVTESGLESGVVHSSSSGNDPHVYPVSIILQTQQQGNLDFTNTVLHMQGAVAMHNQAMAAVAAAAAAAAGAQQAPVPVQVSSSTVPTVDYAAAPIMPPEYIHHVPVPVHAGNLPPQQVPGMVAVAAHQPGASMPTVSHPPPVDYASVHAAPPPHLHHQDYLHGASLPAAVSIQGAVDYSVPSSQPPPSVVSVPPHLLKGPPTSDYSHLGQTGVDYGMHPPHPPAGDYTTLAQHPPPPSEYSQQQQQQQTSAVPQQPLVSQPPLQGGGIPQPQQQSNTEYSQTAGPSASVSSAPPPNMVQQQQLQPAPPSAAQQQQQQQQHQQQQPSQTQLSQQSTQQQQDVSYQSTLPSGASGPGPGSIPRPANIHLVSGTEVSTEPVASLMSPPPGMKDPIGASVPKTGTETEDAESASGASTVAIDNKIEQAMDLVKSHLMFAVREEVDVLKERITELMERISQLEYENNVLRASASPETLAILASQPPPPNKTQPPSAIL